MDNNNNMDNNGNAPENTNGPEKMFTQDDVNRIVSERLARERAGQQADARELELQQRENGLYMKELVAGGKIPQDIADALKGLDKEKIDSLIGAVAPYIRKAEEPIMNPTGSTRGTGGGCDPIRVAMGLKG